MSYAWNGVKIKLTFSCVFRASTEKNQVGPSLLKRQKKGKAEKNPETIGCRQD